MTVQVVERRLTGVGDHGGWSITDDWEEFDTRDEAYDAICEVIGKQPGFMEREPGLWEVTQSAEHIFQILEVS